MKFSTAAEPEPVFTYLHKDTINTATWIPIRMQQTYVDDRFKVVFWYNGVSVKEEFIDKPRRYNNTRIMVGDKHWPAMPGTIKNLKVTTGMIS